LRVWSHIVNIGALPVEGEIRQGGIEMAKQYKVVARIISIKGKCSLGHRVGDEFEIGHVTPIGMCSWAFYTIFPCATVLQYGGSLPWESDPDKAVVACPDPANPVVFELRRIGRRRKPA
jgi:uncharacterized repeat protein (TIGR04076 family)